MLRATGALWSVVLLIYLPMMVRRHGVADLAGLTIEVSTVAASMLLAVPLFALFRSALAQPPARRIAVLALGIVGAAAGQAAYDLLLVRWLAAEQAAVWPAMARDLIRGYSGLLNDATVFAVNAGLFQLALNRRVGRRQERALATLRAAGQQAELEALRFRLNPHFLFNTLNGISAMIVTRRLDEADEMVDRLSAFLRAALGGSATALVTVEQELAVVDHYCRIEQFRFGDRLATETRCTDAACRRAVPPLLVQQLVEQAVEAASRADVPARVSVAASIEGAALAIVVAHPHMAMSARHLAAARARVADWPGAQVLRGDGETCLCLPLGGKTG